MALEAGGSTRARPLLVKVAGWAVALFVIILLLLAILLALFLRHDASGQSTFLGHPVYSVASGSMAPTFDTGDLIIDTPVSGATASHLHKGQIITFSSQATGPSATSVVVTHRIYQVVTSPEAGGGRTVEYRTKGDANNAPDQSLVPSSAVQGVYARRLPYGGYVLSALHQPITFVILIMIPSVYLVSEEVRRRWVRLGERDAERRGGATREPRPPW